MSQMMYQERAPSRQESSDSWRSVDTTFGDIVKLSKLKGVAKILLVLAEKIQCIPNANIAELRNLLTDIRRSYPELLGKDICIFPPIAAKFAQMFSILIYLKKLNIFFLNSRNYKYNFNKNLDPDR